MAIGEGTLRDHLTAAHAHASAVTGACFGGLNLDVSRAEFCREQFVYLADQVLLECILVELWVGTVDDKAEVGGREPWRRRFTRRGRGRRSARPQELWRRRRQLLRAKAEPVKRLTLQLQEKVV